MRVASARPDSDRPTRAFRGGGLPDVLTRRCKRARVYQKMQESSSARPQLCLSAANNRRDGFVHRPQTSFDGVLDLGDGFQVGIVLWCC